MMNWRANPPAEMADPAAARRWRQQGLVYAGLMPLISHLPTRWAYAAARLRGLWAAHHGRDWVELAQGQTYVRARTEAAWRAIEPLATASHVSAIAQARFQTWLEEELEACWITRGAWSRFGGLDTGPAQLALAPHADHGLVLVQAHFNNPTLACAAAGMATGRPVWMTVSGIYEDDRVHPGLRALFRGKYRGVESRLNGGKLLHSESPASMRQLYRALDRGEVVIVVADLPPEPGSDGVCVPWLGGHRLLAAGAHRLASRTGSHMGSLWLHTDRPGHWTLNADVAEPKDEAHATAHVYARLARVLLDQPGRWWAAHLWPETPVCEPQPADFP